MVTVSNAQILTLENHLQRISRRFVSIQRDSDIAFRQHFENVSSYVIECIKHKDPLFARMLQQLQLAGSYADDIKVTAPNEFDVLVILKFPKPVPIASSPGYVTVNIKDGLNTWTTWWAGNGEKYKRFIDSNGYLIQDQILDWLRVLVREILLERRNISINGSTYQIQQSNSGPAVTLEVDVENSRFGGFFSIDLVPSLQFQSSNAWVADNRPLLTVSSNRFWNAIPKPNKSYLHKNRNWICSYAEIERDYLNGLNRLKPLIRLFKKIRDTACLTNLKSYYIKTIFLHVRRKKPECYWNRSLALLFMEMFDVILEHFRTATLWSLWHHNYNLLGQLNDYQSDNIYHNLKSIKNKIERNLANNNPDIIYSVILTMEEMSAMEQKEVEESESWCTIL